MCVRVELARMTAQLPSMRQHLREAVMEMCVCAHHHNTQEHTHTLRLTNAVSSLV